MVQNLHLNNYEIRPFIQEDMDKISKILMLMDWAPKYIQGQKQSIETLTDEEGKVFVAVSRNVMMGHIHIQHLRWNQLSYIHGLVVSPHCRRQGIAHQLITHVEQEAKEQGNRGVFVDTPVNNQAARAFYINQGYAEAYTMPNYYEDELDGIAYLKLFKSEAS